MGSKIVLDTNVFISALGWEGNPRKILQECIEGKYQLCISRAIILEISKVLSYPKFNFIQSQIDDFIALIAEITTLIEPDFTLVIISTDPSDNRILECALAADCRYIVTGDKHLLELGTFQNIQIVSPEVFLSTDSSAEQ